MSGMALSQSKSAQAHMPEFQSPKGAPSGIDVFQRARVQPHDKLIEVKSADEQLVGVIPTGRKPEHHQDIGRTSNPVQVQQRKNAAALGAALSNARPTQQGKNTVLRLFFGTQPWLTYSFLPSKWIHTPLHQRVLAGVADFLVIVFRSWSQCAFVNSPLAGVIIFLALLIHNQWWAVVGMVCAVVTNAFALMSGFNSGVIRSGVAAFNGILTGITLATYDPNGDWNWPILGPAVVCSIFACCIFVGLGSLIIPLFNIGPSSFPYTIATWAMLGGMGTFQYFPGNLTSSFLTRNIVRPDSPIGVDWSELMLTVLRGVGQLAFVDKLVPSIMVIVSMFICSPIACFFALLGSLICVLTSVGLGINPQIMYNGIYCVPSVLAGLSLSGMFYVLSPASVCLALFSAVLCTFTSISFDKMLSPLGIPALSLPYVTVYWTMSSLQNSFAHLSAVPISALSIPEDNYRRYHLTRFMVREMRSAVSKAINRLENINTTNLSTTNTKPFFPEHKDTQQQGEKPSGAVSSSVLQLHGADVEMTVSKRQPSEMHVHEIVEQYAGEAAARWYKLLLGENQNGLSRSVIKEMLNSSGLLTDEQRFDEWFRAVDVDGNGVIDLQEFSSLLLYIHRHKVERQVADFFDIVDSSRNGFIDIDTIVSAFSAVRAPPLTTAEKRILSCVGISGRITEVDLISFIEPAGLELQPRDARC